MPIKVNFADAFLQSYGPGAQQGAAQFQAMQKQKAQEQQFQLERADAMAKFQQQQELQNRELASSDEYRKGQLANQTADNARQQAKVDAEQADMRTASQGMKSLASGEVPNPRQRIADIGGMFLSQGPRDKFIEDETEKVDRHEASMALRKAKAHPAFAANPILAQGIDTAAMILEQGGKGSDVFPMVRGLYAEASKESAGLKHLTEYQSRLQARIDKRRAIADALDEEGEYDRAQEIYDQIEQAESAFAPGEIEPEKSRESYNAALKVLQPGRSGTSKQKEAEGPITYREAYKAAQGGISAADVKALNQSMREAAVDEVLARGGSEEEAKTAAKKVRSVTLSEMHDREAERLIARDARDRKGPEQSAPQAPQQMNGQAPVQNGQAPAQAAPAQALPPAEFTKRKPEEQQGFLSEIEADLRDGGGTNLEAIYQKFGVLPGTLPPAVKARLKRAASGG